MIPPLALPVKLLPEVAKTLCKVAALGPSELEEHRRKTLSWYRLRAEHLEDAEAALHRKLEDGVERVVQDKSQGRRGTV